ncbi:MAG: Eco57I restriction-modification methylase domain-containing protein [Candidatus Heimdallarchaeaceae archaeon]
MTSYIPLSLSDVVHKISIYESELNLFNSSKKKNFGIYYTPDFIVDYIVSNAFLRYLSKFDSDIPQLVKKILSLNSNLSNHEKKILTYLHQHIFPNITVCDISMGWGVFLIHTFDYLFLLRKNVFILLYSPSSSELEEESKKIAIDIIQNSLFGVDLSEKAIELAQLKLFKQVMEALNCSNIKLPRANFRQGNSLLGFINKEHINGKDSTNHWVELFLSKFKKKTLVTEVYNFLRKQKLVHWKLFFPQLRNREGFDIIVGNPPYINVKRLPQIERYIYASIYETYNPNGDLSNVFWERALSILRPSGVVSFIVPRYWLEGKDSNKLRYFIQKNSRILEIMDFQSNRSLFSESEKKLGVDVSIVTLEKRKEKGLFDVYILQNSERITSINKHNFLVKQIDQESLSSSRWNFNVPKLVEYLDEHSCLTLGGDKENNIPGVCYIGKGCSTGNNSIFTLKKIKDNIFEGYKKVKLSLPENEQRVLRRLIKNSDITRYFLKKQERYWIFLKDKSISDYPMIEQYLHKYIEKLKETQKKYGSKNFFDYAAYRSLNLIDSVPKIVTPYQSSINRFALVKSKTPLTINETDVITLVIKQEMRSKLDWFFLLSLLNSELLHYYIKHRNKKIYYLYDFRTNQITTLPIQVSHNQKVVSFFSECMYRAQALQLDDRLYMQVRSKLEFIINSLIFEIYLREKLSSELEEVLQEIVFTQKPEVINLKRENEFLSKILSSSTIIKQLRQIYSNEEITSVVKDLSLPYSKFIIK